MLSKFNIEKPEYVLYKRGRARFEAERSVVSLPLLEACEERMRHLLAENDQLHASKKEDSINYGKIIQSQASELVKKRTQVFQLKQELKLFCEEVTRSRLPVNSAKNTVKFNVSRHSYWELDKSTRSLKRKKIRQYIQIAVEILPAEFKPVEVSIFKLCAKLVRIRPWSSLLCYSSLN